MTQPLHRGQLALALGVLAIGAFFLIGSYYLPDAAGYSTVGPSMVPRAVGAGLVLLGALLAVEVWRGGFRHHDESAEAARKSDWRALAWVSAGLLGYGLTIEQLGFVISSVWLFLMTARAFGSRRWLLNACIALVLAGAVFATFNYGLGLNLPKGILGGILKGML